MTWTCALSPGRAAHGARLRLPAAAPWRYTSAMKIVVPFRRRRLRVLCAASAAIHLALLELVARHGSGAPAAMPAPGQDIVLRLVSPPKSAAVTAPAGAAPAPARRPVAAAAHMESAASAARPVPALPASSDPAPAATPALPALDAAAGQPGALPELPSSPLTQMPGRYRVRLPGSVSLRYVQVLQRPGAPAQPLAPARIDWHTDGQRYRLEVDGVMGRLHSEGEGGDAGIVPRRLVEDGGAGERVTDFDHDGGRVLFRAGGAEAPASIGIQDPASLLVQLAGIGLGRPDQIADRISIVVADGAQATIVRFQVLEMENVDTALGAIEARRLAQVAAPGQPRLEIWLSPSRDWLPVQIRLSRADGASATQTLSAIEGAADSAP